MRKRRRLQFSIRTLFVVVILCCLPLMWVGTHLERSRREKTAARLLERGGAGVEFRAGGPGYLRAVVGDRALEVVGAVSFVGRQVTEEQLAAIRGLRGLRELHLMDCRIDGRILETVKSIRSLESLYLSGSLLGDTDLRELRDMPNLKVLVLSETDVSDQDVEDLPNVRTLGLDCTEVTDQGLHRLSRLSNLEVISLIRTNVTAEGVSALRRSLPHLEVIQ